MITTISGYIKVRDTEREIHEVTIYADQSKDLVRGGYRYSKPHLRYETDSGIPLVAIDDNTFKSLDGTLAFRKL